LQMNLWPRRSHPAGKQPGPFCAKLAKPLFNPGHLLLIKRLFATSGGRHHG
jgi:hypothetical protein